MKQANIEDDKAANIKDDKAANIEDDKAAMRIKNRRTNQQPTDI